MCVRRCNQDYSRMNRKILYYIIILGFSLYLAACTEERVAKLPPVEDRVSEAITNLRSDLTAPANGWRLEYQPTDGSGIFFMLLDFNEEEVNIRSDLAANDGEFFDHTIPWRVDNAMGLELIFETYGVLHYLFELDAATFGAEFEWAFVLKDGENLVFRSISDVSFSQSNIILVPADADDDELLERNIDRNLMEYTKYLGPRVFGPPDPRQQIIIENAGISVYWALDPVKRIITSSLAGTGVDFDDPDFTAVILNHNSGYKLQNGSLVLLEPLQFVLAGSSYTINSIAFTEFSNTAPGLCNLTPDNGPLYSGQIPGLGSAHMVASLFDLEGNAFQPISEFPYSVNSFFIFDETGTSLSDDDGIIAEKFPNATGFLFYYGFESQTQPSHAVGFVLDNGDGSSDIYLREFEPATTSGNRIRVVLTNNYFHSGVPDPGDQASLAEITDLLFEGSDMYASDLPVEGLTVFALFNPCNKYEIYLVQ